MRSTRGKIRLAIAWIVFIGILSGIGYFGFKNISAIIREGISVTATPVPTEAVTHTPTPKVKGNVTDTPAQTNTPTPTRGPIVRPADRRNGEIANTPTPYPIGEPFIDAKSIDEGIWSFVLSNKDGKIKYNGKEYEIGAEGLFKFLCIDNDANRCREIQISEVTVGDAAMYKDIIALCIGIDNGHPVFMYFGNDNTVNTEYGDTFNVFAGYSQADSDLLYCGCLPIPCTKFYDTGYGDGNSGFSKYAEKWHKYDWEELSLMHEMAIAMAKSDQERFFKVFFDAELARTSIYFLDGYPKKAMPKFLSSCKADAYSTYTVIPVKLHTYSDSLYKTEYRDYEVQIISLDADTFLQTSGSWHFMICVEDGVSKVTPHSYARSLRECSGIFGLTSGVKEDSGNKDNTENGNTGSTEDGKTENQSGKEIAIDDNASLVDLDENIFYVVTSDLSDKAEITEAAVKLCDTYEKAGFKVNRDLGAYYSGTWKYLDEKDHSKGVHYIKGEWHSVIDKEVVGFVDERITEFWYYIQDGNLYFYFGRQHEYPLMGEYYGWAFYCIAKDGHMYQYVQGLDDEFFWDYSDYDQCDRHFEMLYGDIYLWIDFTQVTSPYRQSGRDTYFAKLVPKGTKKSMFLADDSTELGVTIQDCTAFCYE